MREWVGDREGGLTDEGERVRLGSVKNSNIFLLEIESLRLGFTFSKACPRGTRVSETRVPRGHPTWNLAM